MATNSHIFSKETWNHSHFSLDCSNKPDGWYADPYSCVKYWNCIGGKATHHICDEGLFYEPVKVQCDYEDRVNCGNRPHCNECDDNCP